MEKFPLNVLYEIYFKYEDKSRATNANYYNKNNAEQSDLATPSIIMLLRTIVAII